MAENTFPMYKADQLVQFFRTDVLTEQEAKQFSKNDLTPAVKPETVQLLYMRTLQLVYRFRPECLYMIPLTEDIENPSFHEGATAIMSLYLCMCRFLPTCLVYDFSLGDLLAPKSKRTAIILSGIMNFLHFRKQRMDFILEHETRFRADMDRFQALNRGIKEAEMRIDTLTTIPPEQQAEARELGAALAELNTANANKFQGVTALKDSIAEWRSKIAERTQALTKLKVNVTTTNENNANLKSQILESPEELKTQMEKMKESVKNIKAATVKADEFLVELQSKAQVLNNTDSEVQLICKLLEDLQTGLDNNKQLMVEVDESVAEFEKQQKEIKTLTTEVDREKRSHVMKLERLSKQQLRRQNMKDMAEQHVQAVMRKCDHVHEKRQEMADQIQEITNETQQLKAKIQNLIDSCNNETRVAQDLYDRLTAALDMLHKRIETHQDDIRLTLVHEKS